MTKRYEKKGRTKRQRRGQREGAAMLIVMMILLGTTSLAVFSVHATSYEVRATGFARQAMQAEYVSEGGLVSALSIVDRLGPQAILNAIGQQQALGHPKPTLQPFEPDYLATTEGYRIYSSDLSSFTAGNLAPITSAALGRQPYTPSFTVDVYDHHLSPTTVPGFPAGGGLHFFHATYTSRSRMQLGSDISGSADPRDYHETASGSRAYGISGPFAQ